MGPGRAGQENLYPTLAVSLLHYYPLPLFLHWANLFLSHGLLTRSCATVSSSCCLSLCLV